jgi:uncharacterized protein (DUF736 family)
MKIGSAWSKTSENGNTYLSVSLEDFVKDLCPVLKDYNISLNYIIYAEGERQENSPSWNVNIYKKKEQNNSNNLDTV